MKSCMIIMYYLTFFNVPFVIVPHYVSLSCVSCYFTTFHFNVMVIVFFLLQEHSLREAEHSLRELRSDRAVSEQELLRLEEQRSDLQLELKELRRTLSRLQRHRLVKPPALSLVSTCSTVKHLLTSVQISICTCYLVC